LGSSHALSTIATRAMSRSAVIMLQRDLLEVSFLLDYFGSNREHIAEWRACSESERNERFGAFRIRTTLDDRDGFTERKREEHYKLLCTLGAHASYPGFELLRPTRGRMRAAGRTLRSARLTRSRPSWRKCACWPPRTSRRSSKQDRSTPGVTATLPRPRSRDRATVSILTRRRSRRRPPRRAAPSSRAEREPPSNGF
jgi:hypothetical protein